MGLPGDAVVREQPTTYAGSTIQWQVNIDDHFGFKAWVDMASTDSTRVERAFMTDRLPVSVSDSRTTWTFDVVQMTQTNNRTHKVRRIRRVLLL
jgi:hypothetical protein